MKFKVIIFGIIVFFSNFCFGVETPMPSNKLQQGTYYLSGKDERMIIELKHGSFRYWFVSDFKMDFKYPLSGQYTYKNGILSLPIPYCRQNKCVYLVGQWHTYLYKNKPALWRHEAIKSWKENKDLDVYGILFLTPSDPQKLWESGWH